MSERYLLDLNVLIALTEPEHSQHRKAHEWFNSPRKDYWAVCPLTEAGFVRVTTNPAFRPGPRSMELAKAILQTLKGYPGYRYWEIDESWVTLTAPFAARVLGHQQVTDAYLLGVAIQKDGVLVTFDKGIERMAGAEFRQNIRLLA